MKAKEQKIQTIKSLVRAAIANNYFIKDREDSLSATLPADIEYWFDDKSMGSGGVGQVNEMKDGTVRFQIGYGRGKYNYARVLIVRL